MGFFMLAFALVACFAITFVPHEWRIAIGGLILLVALAQSVAVLL